MRTLGDLARVIRRAPRNGKATVFREALEKWGEARGKTTEVLGPAGLTCRYFLRAGRRWRELELDMPEGVFWKRDYSKRVSEFPRGSIGALNGMNFVAVKLPLSLPLDELFARPPGETIYKPHRTKCKQPSSACRRTRTRSATKAS